MSDIDSVVVTEVSLLVRSGQVTAESESDKTEMSVREIPGGVILYRSDNGLSWGEPQLSQKPMIQALSWYKQDNYLVE